MRSTWSPGLGSTLRVQRIVSAWPTIPMSIISPRLKRPTTSSARSGLGDGSADGFGAADMPIEVNTGTGRGRLPHQAVPAGRPRGSRAAAAGGAGQPVESSGGHEAKHRAIHEPPPAQSSPLRAHRRESVSPPPSNPSTPSTWSIGCAASLTAGRTVASSRIGDAPADRARGLVEPDARGRRLRAALAAVLVPDNATGAPTKRLDGSTGEATKCQRGEGLAREASRHGAQGAGVALFDVQGGEGGKRTCHRRGQ